MHKQSMNIFTYITCKSHYTFISEYNFYYFLVNQVAMQLFMLIAIIHVAEIIFLSVFCSALSAERYLYSSILLLYYISAHYIFNHILQSEKHFGHYTFISEYNFYYFLVNQYIIYQVSYGRSQKDYSNTYYQIFE